MTNNNINISFHATTVSEITWGRWDGPIKCWRDKYLMLCGAALMADTDSEDYLWLSWLAEAARELYYHQQPSDAA